MNESYMVTNPRGENYYLHSKVTVLKNGRQSQFYYFKKGLDQQFASGKPDNRVVSFTPNGLPVLKKI